MMQLFLSLLISAAATVVITATSSDVLLNSLEKHLPEAFNFSSFGPCLDQHQYRLWHRMMRHGECDSFLPGAEKLAFKLSDGDFFDLIRHDSDALCSIVDQLSPCIYALVDELLLLVTDTTHCFNPPLVSTDYNRTDLFQLLDSFLSAVCATKSTTSDRCIAVTMAHLDPDANLIKQFLNMINKCDTTLECCGEYYVSLGQSLGKLDLKRFHQYLPLFSIILSKAPCSIQTGCLNDHLPVHPEPDNSAGDPIDDLQPIVPVYAPSEPQQIHLAFAADDAMSVMFTTVESIQPFVQFGIGNLERIATCVTDSYTKDLIEVPITYQHKCIMSQLQQNQTYSYQCSNGESKSQVFSFQLDAQETKVAIFGDMGLYGSQNTVQLLESLEQDVSFYFHIGDIAYADNWFLHNLVTFGYENVWNSFMNVIQSFATSKPYMVLPGNHEAECHEPLTCGRSQQLNQAFGNYTAFNHRFHMPSSSSDGKMNMWYSFNHGLVHFVSISTECDFTGAPLNNHTSGPICGFGDQMKWLEKDLRQAALFDRKVRPWIIVLGHRPIYQVSHSTVRGTALKLQQWLEPLFEKYHVDLYLAGHVHSYERMSPIHRNQAHPGYVNPKYTTYVVHGSSGNEESHSKEPVFNATHPPPEWTEHYDFKHLGVGVLTIHNRSCLSWEFLQAPDRMSRDSFTLTSDHTYGENETLGGLNFLYALIRMVGLAFKY